MNMPNDLIHEYALEEAENNSVVVYSDIHLTFGNVFRHTMCIIRSRNSSHTNFKNIVNNHYHWMPPKMPKFET